MGRRHSPQYLQSVIDMWRRRLLAVSWAKSGIAGDMQLLAAAVGNRFDDTDPKQRKRYTMAVKGLWAAALGLRDAPDRPDTLDAWIERNLVRHGSDLLISEEV